jgi:FixJ family two-component response regulator
MDDYTVLLVDDELNILNSLKRLLLDEDFRIMTATSGEQGLALLGGGERPAVIVSDQRMPGMEGSEFLARTREIAPDSIRIMLTGYSDIGAAVDAVNRGGISRYITKPWNDEDLKLTIRDAQKRYALIMENGRLTAELQEKNRLLEEFNADLERKVKERTSDLLRKMKELQGRDRIQQHLLTLTPLEETLRIVLAVIREVLEVETAAIYLLEDDGKLSRVAIDGGPGDAEMGPVPPPAKLEAVLLRAFHHKEPYVLKAKAASAKGPPNENALQLAVVPVSKNDQPLAVIEARRSGDGFAPEDLHTISSFGMQAAIAISDSRLRAGLPSLEAELDDFLLNLKDPSVE